MVFMHHVKTVGQKVVPVGRDTREVLIITVLDSGPSHPTERGDMGYRIGIGTPSQNLHCKLWSNHYR